MSDIVRLLDGDADALERELLQSAVIDAPAPEVRERTLIALGVTSGVIAGGAAGWAGSSGTGAGTSSVAAPVASGKAAGWFGVAGLAKWFGGGIAGGLLFAGAAAAISQPDPPPRAAVLAPVERPAPAPVETHVQVPAPAVIQTVPRVSVAAPPRPVERSAARAPKRHAPEDAVVPAAAPTVSTTSVLGEVALLDAARTALQSGDLATARGALREHQQRYPAGTLAPEATLLRIRMLLSTGQRDEATSLAEGFLRRHPKSPYARRIHSLLRTR